MTTAHPRPFIPIAPCHERTVDPGEWNDWIALGAAVVAFIAWCWRHSLGAFCKWVYSGLKAPQRIEELLARLDATAHDTHTAIGLARATWDTLSCAVWQSDNLGMCVHVNTTYREMLGFQFSELAGEQWKQTIHPEDKYSVYEEWSSAVRERRPFNMRYRWQTKDGEIIPVHAQASVLLDSKGKVSGWVGFVTDLRPVALQTPPTPSTRRRPHA